MRNKDAVVLINKVENQLKWQKDRRYMNGLLGLSIKILYSNNKKLRRNIDMEKNSIDIINLIERARLQIQNNGDLEYADNLLELATIELSRIESLNSKQEKTA